MRDSPEPMRLQGNFAYRLHLHPVLLAFRAVQTDQQVRLSSQVIGRQRFQRTTKGSGPVVGGYDNGN